MSKVELGQRACLSLSVIAAVGLVMATTATPAHAGQRRESLTATQQTSTTSSRPWRALLELLKRRPPIQQEPTAPTEPPANEPGESNDPADPDTSEPTPPPAPPTPPPAPEPQVWRPFSDDSPWNTPIPANAVVDPQSSALIDDLEGSSPYGPHLDVNITHYSIPLFFANASTPMVNITAAVGGYGWGAGNFDATMPMPMPAGAAPDPESDHHIAVIDQEAGLEWDCWDFDGSTHAGLCATADLSGTGVRPRHDQASPWSEAHGARACGFPLVAGLIRPEEIEAGEINHALAIAYPHIRAGFYVPPASTAQARVGNNSISTRGIPCGGRVQLDPSINVDALDASDAAKTILRAMQVYGAYVGDYSGAITIYADGSPDAQAAWQGVLATDEVANILDLNDLRVLEIGPMIDNGNGG